MQPTSASHRIRISARWHRTLPPAPMHFPLAHRPREGVGLRLGLRLGVGLELKVARGDDTHARAWRVVDPGDRAITVVGRVAHRRRGCHERIRESLKTQPSHQVLRLSSHEEKKTMEKIFDLPPEPPLTSCLVYDGTIYSPECNCIFFAEPHPPKKGFSAQSGPWICGVSLNVSTLVTEKVYPAPRQQQPVLTGLTRHVRSKAPNASGAWRGSPRCPYYLVGSDFSLRRLRPCEP